MTLGEELANASDGILELILSTRSRKRKEALREQLTEILELTGKLVEANVQKDSKDYRAAAAELSETNDAIKEAKEDLRKVAATITKIAKAIDVVGKLAATVA
jgi:hypothetical protein